MENFTSDQINKSQRQCISHILRNCEQSLEGITAVIENQKAKISAEDIKSALIKIRERLNKVIEATSNNQFCALSSEECKFVCTHVKCDKISK